MTSESVSLIREVGSHPLSPLRSIIDEHELEPFWSEFEAIIPNLFITEASNCKVEIIEIASSNFSPSQQIVTEERIQPENNRNSIERVSSIEELNIILQVCYFTSKVVFISFNKNNLIHYSENYSLALQGYCR